MGTIVAVETDGGVAIAGDKRATSGGTVTGASATRVFDVDDRAAVGAGAAGAPGDIDAFRRRLDSEVASTEFERDRETAVDALARLAAAVAQDTGVRAVVATHDEDGVARLRQIGADGSVLTDPVVALGSGAEVALGRLEGTDRDRDLDATAAFVRETVEAAAERDPETGTAVDVWSLGNESADG